MEPAPGLIELRLNHVGQLFNTMDPSPFHERDLDHDAEEFIVSWARELRVQGRKELRLRVVLHQAADPAVTELVRQSLRHYFAYRAEVSRRELHGLLREGRTALGIGLTFLAATLALRGLLPAAGWGDWVREGLIICGWVGLWKPIDIHLYRWWPLRAQAKLQARLSACPVEVDFQPLPPAILGVKGNVIIGHGISNDIAVKNMIKHSYEVAKSGLASRVNEAFN